MRREYGLELAEKPGKGYGAVVLAVSHKEYKNLGEEYFRELMDGKPLLVDVKGLYRDKGWNMAYWSL